MADQDTTIAEKVKNAAKAVANAQNVDANNINSHETQKIDLAYVRFPNGNTTGKGTSPGYKLIGTPGKSSLYGRVPNANKVINICFYQYKNSYGLLDDINQVLQELRSDTAEWDNWKKGKPIMANSYYGYELPEVPDNVYPEISNYNIKGGVEFNFLNVGEALKKGGGQILGTIKDVATTVRSFTDSAAALTSAASNIVQGGGSRTAANTAISNARQYDLVSKLDEFGLLVPADTKYVSPGSIELTFTFGNAGYFDGEIEVLRPIMAMVNSIAPQFYSGSKHRITGPVATPTQFYAAMWGATSGAAADAIKNIFNTDTLKNGMTSIGNVAQKMTSGNVIGGLNDAAKGIGNIAESVTEAVTDAQEAAVNAAGYYSTFLFYRLGQYIAGPFQVSSIEYNLDYSYVDESGYPYKGTVTLSIQSLFKPTAYDILASAGYKSSAKVTGAATATGAATGTGTSNT